MTVSRFVAVLAGVCLTIAGVRGVYSSDLADFAPGPTTAAVAAQTTVTRHRGQFNRSVIDYQAIAAETPIVNAAGRVGARIFSVSYVKDGETTAPSRPVVFLFNGGPGASSVYLHLGGLGPRKVLLPGDKQAVLGAPYALADNPDCLLDVADLVFVDPVGTGLSQLLESPKDYQSIAGDAHAVTQFIRLWLTGHHRWNSPKYLLGESYGTHRAAAIVRELLLPAGSEQIAFNGVILLGQALDFTQTRQVAGNDTPYVVYLPSFAAAAWYHDKVDKTGWTLESFLAAARKFAQTELLTALYQGSDLPAQEKTRVAATMAKFSGLPASVIERENLRITTTEFAAELLRGEGRMLQEMDARYTQPVVEAVNGYSPGYLPRGMAEIFTAGINSYLESELHVHTDRSYALLSVVDSWDFTLPDQGNPFQNYLNLAPYIANAMQANTSTRLFIGSGLYDLQAAFASAERTVTHNNFPRARTVVKSYSSGHMIYLQEDGIRALNADLRVFIAP